MRILGWWCAIEALRVRDFRLLWSARLVSLLGSWLLVVAVPAHVFALTGSVAASGLTLAAQFVPPLLLGPVVGVLVDRWDRRRCMVAADLARCAAVALLLLATGPGDVWLVYLALVAESAGTVVFQPAAQAQTPAVVGTGSALSSANALNAGADGAVRLAGGPLGGVLLAVAGFELLVWLDAASYLVSAVAILATSARPRAAPPTRGGPRRVCAELRDGVRFLRGEPTAAALVLVNTVFLGANACLTALLVPYAVTELGGSAQAGLVMAALGVGFLVGAWLLRVLVDRVPPGYLLGAVLTGTGGGYALLFSPAGLAVALGAAALLGALGSVAVGTVQTTLQRVTPDAVLGRSSSALFTGEAAASLTGALVGPAVAAALSVPSAAYLAGAASVLGGLTGVLLLPRSLVRAPAG